MNRCSGLPCRSISSGLYSFDVSEDLANRSANLDDTVRLRLKVSTWKPSDVLGVVDDRELGVIVTRVEVR